MMAAVHLSKIVHCDFEESQNQHFQSTLGREGRGHKKQYSLS